MNVLGAQERPSAWLLIACALLGAWSLYNGIQTWRGWELQVVRRMEADPAAASRWALGGRRRYQTFYGNGLAGIPGGLGFLLVALGLSVRDALDKPVDWAPGYVAAVVGAGLIGVAAIYTLAYFWTGVPDALRPPSQRGQLEQDDPTGQRRRRRRHQRVLRALRAHRGDEP